MFISILATVLALSATALASTTASANPDPDAPFSIDRVEGGTFYFKGKAAEKLKPLKTELHEIRSLSVLPAPEGAPYVLFTAKPCANCTAESSIYIARASGGRVHQFTYPGKILDPKTRALLHDSRAFYGQCLGAGKEVYVMFQREKVDRRSRLATSVFIVEGGRDHIEEKLIERRLPSITATLRHVKAKRCFEVDSRNRMMSSKPFKLSPRTDQNDDEEGEDTPKENQTEKDLPSAPDSEDNG